MNHADRMARKAANLLQGTCMSVADLGEEYEALQNNYDFCRTFDSLVFCCYGCEQWRDKAEAEECEGGFICEECSGVWYC